VAEDERHRKIMMALLFVPRTKGDAAFLFLSMGLACLLVARTFLLTYKFYYSGSSIAGDTSASYYHGFDSFASSGSETQHQLQPQQHQLPNVQQYDARQHPREKIDKDRLLQLLGLELKPWQPWDFASRGKELPCYPGQIDTLEPKGFVFVKPKKCGSTTGSSITVRIARSLALKQGHPMCQCWTDHKPAYNIGVGNRLRSQSWLWSVVRNPTKRVTSEFFHFHVSRENASSDDATFLRFLNSEDGRRTYENFFVRYLQAKQRRWNPLAEDIASLFSHILEEQTYDFIALTERMEESAVVMQLLLNLATEDIMYLSSKTSGDYDDGRWNNQCYLIRKSFISEGMKRHFQSQEFKSAIFWDELLYHAINKKLDMTIDALGKSRFDAALAKFRNAKNLVNQECASQVRLPCTSNGVKRNETDCLLWDIGCGFDCMDRAMMSTTKVSTQ